MSKKEINIWSKLQKVLSNKVILYLFSRYFIFFIQFISSIYLAIKLEPYYFGIWGFILLMINYLSYINFGIDKSLNILIVQNKKNNSFVKDFVSNSFFLVGLLSILITFLSICYLIFDIKLFEKYDIGNYFYIICIISILFHFNSLMGTIYRFKNRLFELAFFQSIIPILIFIVMFMAKGIALLSILLGATVIGHIATLIVFLKNKKVPFGGQVSVSVSLKLLNKGSYLFIYNVCFFLIILSTRTMISYFYSVEDFGYFTFSYTLANAILLLLQALSVVIFPKIIDKLHSNKNEVIKNIITTLNLNYITLSYALMFTAMIFFPVFLNFIPKYEGTLKVLNLTGITVLLFTNSFGYASHLMAQNKEKVLSIISFFSLFINIGISLILILIFKVSYEYVIISTLISYLFFGYSCTRFSNKLIARKNTYFNDILDFFPIRLLMPYLTAVMLIIFNFENFMFLTLIVFILFNKNEAKQIIKMISKIIKSPNLVDI